MSHEERFRAVMSFQPVDRLPRVEWAMWWDKTIARWVGEGLALSKPFSVRENRLALMPEMTRALGLDVYQQHWFRCTDGKLSTPAYHGAGIITDEEGYERERPHLYPSNEWLNWTWERLAQYQAAQERGECLLWITLPGFFGTPRNLFGIERHLLAFYEQPELMHRINRDVAEYTIRLLRKTAELCRPVFATIGEDMSFNSGPMLSRELFDEFLAPYYRRVVPVLKEMGTRVFVDSDGDVTQLIPWLLDVGVEGMLPLERRAGVDGAQIRQAHPGFLMIGHFDKLTMSQGEAAMRAEFERLRPLIRAGGFIPSVDHQTPPEVSLDQYRIYRRLQDEYTRVDS